MVKREITLIAYCTKDGKCVRQGFCKDTDAIASDTDNGRIDGDGIGKEWHICPYLILERDGI